MSDQSQEIERLRGMVGALRDALTNCRDDAAEMLDYLAEHWQGAKYGKGWQSTIEKAGDVLADTAAAAAAAAARDARVRAEAMEETCKIVRGHYPSSYTDEIEAEIRAAIAQPPAEGA